MIRPVSAHNRWLVPVGLALIVSGVVVLLVAWLAPDVEVSGMAHGTTIPAHALRNGEISELDFNDAAATLEPVAPH
jgi:hypothetical protein